MSFLLEIKPKRLFAGIISIIMLLAPFGIGKNGAGQTGAKKTMAITVSENGAYKTIEAARDYIRTLDKTKYSEIIVTVESGEYTVTEPILFTEEDSGNEECTIHYVGKDGATVVGGVALTAKDFSKADGDLTPYFPADVKDKIVTVDLKNFGFTTEMIEEAMANKRYLNTIPFLSANGNRQMLAQYPNDWLHVEHTVTHSDDGTTNTAIDYVTVQTVEYGDEHAAMVQSFSEVMQVFVRARLFKLWCPGDSVVTQIYKDCDKVDILFAGDHDPDDGTIMYFYNVPEALDIPGEYIIDKNAILYYYPTDTFESDVLSLPISEGIVRLDGAKYLTFENLTFNTCLDDALRLDGDHITLKDSRISGVQGVALRIDGDANLVENNVIHDAGEDGIVAKTGDNATATGDGVVITNNDIYDCSVTNGYGYCISASGVNVNINHNDCHDSNFKGIHVHDVVNAIVEYNDVWHMMLLSDDVGAISGDSMQNANVVFRYNYVHDIGPIGEAAKIKDYNPDFKYMGAVAFYFDGGCSYMEVCNNVIKGCDTGYLSNGGRGNSCHNNMVIDCHDWYIIFSEIMYSNALDSDGNLHGSTHFDDFVYNDTWKKLNPDLASLKTTTKDNDPNDPLLWLAPVGNTCYDNIIYFNKADRNFSNWGVRPFNIEKYVKQFSADSMQLDGNTVIPNVLHSYSSKRADIVLEDAITESSELLGMTLEQFNTIGRIED